MRLAGLSSILVVLACALVAGCSTPPAICSGLDNGQNTLTAARNAYGDAGGDPRRAATMLRDGAHTVRTSCSEHDRAASELERYADLVARQARR